MPAAIAVPLALGAVSAGTQLYGAKKASDASKNAAKAQKAASDQAFQYQRQERDRMSGLNAPFMNGMGDRVSTLRSLTTPGQSYMPPQMRQPMPQPMGPQGPPMQQGPPPPQGFMDRIRQMQNPQTLGGMRPPMQQGPPPMDRSQQY